MTTLMDRLGVDASPESRGIAPDYEYENGVRVANLYWGNSPMLHAMGDPLDRTSTAAEQIEQARTVLGIEVTDEEARGFTDRWNELQAGAE